ncbi:NAD(P)-binding protein [Rhizodiscina lignyota]|uniref:NAD(P)-binding protein n=1 Tax=Rhizodiscina lignyota TaxID=1504668 RepID=A0A9P4INZ3_9PEZI|nr:NAD(P)-binding protein [Rhizodiscina lignyota]
MLTTAFQCIGAAYLIYAAYRILDFNSIWLLPKKSLSRYQRRPERAWALITGASAGIGRGCAEELAARGFSVILLGHKPDELALVQREINRNSPTVDVKVLVLDVIKATNAEIEQTFKTISALPITILVNNVGGVPIAQPAIRGFADQTADEIDRTINLNARFMAQLTRLMLPVLAQNGPSLMMNLSSIGHLGMLGVVPYSGTKAYVAAISRGIARETKASGRPVDIVAVLPVEVATESNNVALQPGTPTSRQFAKAMMDYVPRAASKGILQLCPYWQHAVQMAIMEMLPEWLFTKIVLVSFKQKMALINGKQK